MLDLEAWDFQINLAYGVTAGLDVQAGTTDMFVYEDLLDAGLMTGLRAFSTGPGLFASSRIESQQHALAEVRRYRDFHGTHNLKSYLVGTRRQRQWVANAASELGMLATTEGGADMELDLTHVMDGFHGNEHALGTGPLYQDVIQLFVRTGVSYTPTMASASESGSENYFMMRWPPHADPKVNRFMPHFVNEERTQRRVWLAAEQQQFVAAAAGAAHIALGGGRIGVGSHGNYQGFGYHVEMWTLAAGGLSPHEVLRAATVLSSEVIGKSNDLGSLTAGKMADLVILDQDPLVDIHNALAIHGVMKNGRLYDGNTLDELWPQPRSRPESWIRRSESAHH